MALRRPGQFVHNVPVGQTYVNVEQAVIYITEDKLKNYLREYTDACQQKSPLFAASSTLVTLAISLVSSEPKDFLLSADTWRAVFFISTAGVAIYFVYSAVWWIIVWWTGAASLDGLMKKIKKDSKVALQEGE